MMSSLFLFRLFISWLALDAFIITTIWYSRQTIKPMFPAFWQNYICDDAPDYFN